MGYAKIVSYDVRKIRRIRRENPKLIGLLEKQIGPLKDADLAEFGTVGNLVQFARELGCDID